VRSALKAMLSLPPDEVDQLVDAGWEQWAQGEDRLHGDMLKNFVGEFEHLLPRHMVKKVGEGEESELSCPAGFHCPCGRIHVHRGDRVQRGPAWAGGDEDGGVDSLGTIIHDNENSGHVTVQWDSRRHGDLSNYGWPLDPAKHEVVHVAFRTVPPKVKAFQEITGLSSFAATEFLQRVGHVSTQAAADLFHNSDTSEDRLRMPLRLFHRCRILPEAELVYQLFAACPPCPCNRPTCAGGVKWTQTAIRHLGREGYVMDIDHRDDTVLVELAGRCNCKIWYPKLAVNAVFDIDTIVEPRFVIGDAVVCKIDGSWCRGVVNTVWWRQLGWGSRPTVPYSVRLHDGRYIFAPHDTDTVIKAAQSNSQGEAVFSQL